MKKLSEILTRSPWFFLGFGFAVAVAWEMFFNSNILPAMQTVSLNKQASNVMNGLSNLSASDAAALAKSLEN
jgi:hypothetical protein